MVNNFTLPLIQGSPGAELEKARAAAWGRRPHPVAIVLLAVVLRVLVIWFVMQRLPYGWFYSHGVELGTLAESLQAGRGLSSPFGGSTGPTALLAPGYPAIIALLFRVFGPFSPAAAIAVMTMQMLCSAGTVLIAMRMAQRCFGVRAANMSGLFWAVSLPLIWMPTIFWETCLSTLLLVGMLDLAHRCSHAAGFPVWALAGAYSGLAALVNPALLPSMLAMLGWAAWQTRKAEWHLPVSLLVACAVFTLWPIRNWQMLHAFIPLRSTVAFELWMGNRGGATGFLDESLFPLFNRPEYQQYVALGEASYMREKTTLAEEYIRAHPATFLKLTMLRAARFWAGTGTQHGSFVFALHALLTSTLGWLGMARLLREHRLRLACLFLLPLLLFPLPYYLTHAEFRYRLIVDPLLTMLAAFAVSGAGETRRHTKPARS